MARPKSPSGTKAGRAATAASVSTTKNQTNTAQINNDQATNDKTNTNLSASIPDAAAVAARATSSEKEQKSGAPGSTPRSVPNASLVDAGSTPAENIAAETKSMPEPRKLEVVKTEPRKNVVVPIKMEEEIRRRAYEIFVERGSTPGSEAEDWLTAEQEVRRRYQKQHSA